MTLQIDSITERLQALGYTIRQSLNAPNCWYASKSEFNYLFALIDDSGKWRVNDVSGNGVFELPRIEREIQEACN